MKLHYDLTVQDINQLFVGLVLIEIFLVAAYLACMLSGHPTKFFDLDAEANFPAWFSSIQLFLISQVFFLKTRQPAPMNSSSRGLLLLGSLGFMFLSADEAARIHETINGVIKHIEWLPRFKSDHGIWIFIYAVVGLVAIAIAAREFRMMWREYRRATMTLMAGVALAILGGVVLEIVSYQYLRSGSTPVLLVIEVAFEEFFEMLGASIALYGALLLLMEGA